MYVAEVAAPRFWLWVQRHNPVASGIDHGGLLQDYLADWLEKGPGIEETGKSAMIFLETIIVALQLYYEDPTVFDLHFDGQTQSRQLKGIYQADGFGSRCFERDHYEKLAALPAGERNPLG